MSIPFKQSPQTTTYVTQGKLKVTRTRIHVDTDQALQGILDGIDHQQGALFSSGYEFPGRYSRWDVGFLNPPLELRSVSSRFELKALNSRGELLLDFIFSHLNRMKSVMLDRGNTLITGSIKSLSKPEFVLEENRTKQPSMFQLIRHIKQMFESTMDPRLGLYGAFGYDLVFQLEPIHLKHKRSLSRPDMVLYIPDEILIVDRKLDCAYKLQYDFEWEGASTESLPRVVQPVHPTLSSSKTSCLPAYLPGQYASIVTQAIEAFRSGDLVEVVPSHTFHETCEESPSAVFSRLSAINPSLMDLFFIWAMSIW